MSDYGHWPDNLILGKISLVWRCPKMGLVPKNLIDQPTNLFNINTNCIRFYANFVSAFKTRYRKIFQELHTYYKTFSINNQIKNRERKFSYY